MSFSSIPLEDFEATFGALTEISSVSLGGTIVSKSDDFFSPASDLLKIGPAIAYPGVFGKNGSVMDGWESRRHNPEHDWVIIKLGPPAATIRGFDIDTAHFAGNEAPSASVDALYSPNTVPTNDCLLWTSLLLPQPLGPSSRHLFELTSSSSIPFTHLRLNNIPDGGIARFRAYGTVVAPHPSAGLQPWDRVEKGEVDLAHSFNGGRVVWSTDEHYGGAHYLLLPGRGETMEDGWHTKRSRTPGHSDSAIIQLGSKGTINELNIDTHHFIGNFPAGVAVHAILSEEEVPPLELESGWTQLLVRSKVGPHAEHFFEVDDASKNQIFSHVRMTIFPDGGVKRLRVFGSRSA
ncbi:allantoicase-like protein [Mrakia frigida]|uniref:allantoicase-like protein n=1 Tax=Mrakia frigida TaxID=29902 RepID=UPI003FCC0ED8